MRPNALLVVALGTTLAVAVACTSSTGGTTASPCDELEACCPAVGAEMGVCISLASGGQASVCAIQLTTYESRGQCAGDGGAGGSTGQSQCVALAGCTEASARSANSSSPTNRSSDGRSSESSSATTSSESPAEESCLAGTSYLIGASAACVSCVQTHCASEFVAECGADWMHDCAGGTDGPYWQCTCACDPDTATSPCVMGCASKATSDNGALDCAEKYCGSEAGC
jgi:hypothetical protein